MTASVLTVGVAGSVACGPAAREAVAPTSSALPSTSASAASTAPPCARMCAVEISCGGDAAACAERCLGFSRLVVPAVTEALATCVDRPRAAGCTDETKTLVSSCLDASLRARDRESAQHIGLFAQAFCEREGSCGRKVAAACVDDASAKIRETLTPAAAGLYGAFRAEIVDEIVACLRGPCERRGSEADQEIARCVDVVRSAPR